MDAETPTIGEIVRSYPMRLCLYGIITFVVYQVVFTGVRAYGAAELGAENGPVESAQAAFAFFAAVCFFIAAIRNPFGRAGLIACGAVVAYATARELDQFFEDVFFDDAYKWLVGLPMVLLTLGAVILHRRRLIAEWMWLLRQPAATLFAVAGIFLCGVCQSLDRPDMWSSVTDPRQSEVTKGMIEEYAELFAYLLLAFSGVEAVILAWRMAGELGGQAITTDESDPHQSSETATTERHRPRIAA